MRGDSDERPLPRQLYKYRAINEFSERMVVADEFFFASPLTFNDPFDTLPSVSVTASQATREAYLRRLVRQNMADQPRSARRALTRATTRVTRREQEEWYRTSLAQTARGVGVCCFAEAPDDVLMWAHYADHHTGICVEVDMRREYFLSPLPMPVRYASERPTLDPTAHDGYANLIDKLSTKASCWSYEKEWRMIEPTGVTTRRFPVTAITAIYLGCRISADDRARVLGWAAQRRHAPKMFQACPSTTAFKLEFVPA